MKALGEFVLFVVVFNWIAFACRDVPAVKVNPWKPFVEYMWCGEAGCMSGRGNE